ncbi:unnamed protein product [Lactuca virosa]|uniref:Transferase, Chloramphenicol acetyltransferase-like domain protein n=1 Tax=Lactuca virosa TaxID=75947 RepID=A0AAU9LW52_9ASTR|nr:unnamed protein product [Lactuca virosa]
MMRGFDSFLAFSKASWKPVSLLHRSFAASLVTTKHTYQVYFFSGKTSVIQEQLEFSQRNNGINGMGEKTTNAIRVMSVQYVKPDKPTPHTLQSYKLSALDQVNAPSYVPFIFFYPNNVNGNTIVNIDNLVTERSKLLRDSLSETLTRFYPFAGKYINDNHIECNDEGVYYVETRYDSFLSSFLAKPDYKLLQGLLPIPPNLKEPTRGYFLSLIQVNFFSCGGVGISMSNSHKLIDGCTYTAFLNSWAAAAKGDQQKMIYPSFVASSLFLSNSIPPTYPSIPLSSLAERPMILNRGRCLTKRFWFNASALQALKERAAASVSSTRVVAVTSLIWNCATAAARKLHGERPSILQTAVNIRGRFTPPLPPNSIGNIIWNAVARCESKDSLRFDTMVGLMNAGIAKVNTSFVEQFKGEQGSNNVIDELKRLGGQMSTYDADYYSSSSMCHSGLYEADFGWGRPVWSCYGNSSNTDALFTNAILLMDTRTGDGIEAWVTLSQEEMDIVERDPDLLLYASVERNPFQD